MKIKQKVYSVVILERFIVETVSIDAHNPLVTTDKKLVDSTVEQLKEQYKLDGQDWEEYIYMKLVRVVLIHVLTRKVTDSLSL